MRRLILAILFLSCTQNVPQTTLVHRLEADVDTLNPLRARSTYEARVIHLLYTPLLYLDEQGRCMRGLATSWTISPDGRLYTFHLDPVATFSNGMPVTARDVLFTLDAVVNPAVRSPLAGRFDQIDLDHTVTPDAHTVVVAFKAVRAAQLTNFTSLYIVPASSRADQEGTLRTTALGSGPYTLERRETGRSILLRRRTPYWLTLAQIERVRFDVIVNDTTAWHAVEIGTVDETLVSSDTWARRRGSVPHVRFVQSYYRTYNFIAWNCSGPVLRDPRIRRALAACIDTRSIIQHLYHGAARQLNGPFLPGSWAADPGVAPIPYAPESAQRTLSDLGFTESHPLAFELLIPAGSRTTTAVAEVMRDNMRGAGVDMTVVQLDPAAYFERVIAGNFDAAYLAWDLDVDPDPYRLFHSSATPPNGKNFVRYRNPVVDRLLEAGSASLDRSDRTRIYHTLHRILAGEQPYTWIAQPAVTWAIRDRIENVRVSQASGLFLWYPADQAWSIKGP